MWGVLQILTSGTNITGENKHSDLCKGSQMISESGRIVAEENLLHLVWQVQALQLESLSPFHSSSTPLRKLHSWQQPRRHSSFSLQFSVDLIWPPIPSYLILFLLQKLCSRQNAVEMSGAPFLHAAAFLKKHTTSR